VARNFAFQALRGRIDGYQKRRMIMRPKARSEIPVGKFIETLTAKMDFNDLFLKARPIDNRGERAK